jgi:hypothetical protein
MKLKLQTHNLCWRWSRWPVDGLKPLSRSCFLHGRNAGFQTKVNELPENFRVSQQYLAERELVRQRHLEIFWEISKDYLRNLPPTVNKFKTSGNVKVWSLVLIREDHIPRMKWPLGLMVKEFPGRDGLTRSVEIKTTKGTTRGLVRIHKHGRYTEKLRHLLGVVSPHAVTLYIDSGSSSSSYYTF